MIVTHHKGQYPITFCDWEAALAALPEDRLILTDSHVVEAVPGLRKLEPLVVPAGEGSKSLPVFGDCLSQMAQRGVKRHSTLVAVGGGVVGDLGGFLAASFMRGIDFIQVPTSLLAMVDSSIGGKVGLDLPEGKNLVGAFWPPKAVYVAVETLQTLPPREYRAGLAEALKMGFIRDPDLLDLVDNVPAMIERAIDNKRQVVEADEFETLGLRATLNFGHTLGHALEALAGYENLLHGEAISIGMVAECELGERLGMTPPGLTPHVRQTLAHHGLPTDWPTGLDVDTCLKIMARDKKSSGTKLAFSFLTGLGSCKLHTDVPENEVRGWLKAK